VRVRAQGATGTRHRVNNITCVINVNKSSGEQIWSSSQNDETVGADVTQSGRAFQDVSSGRLTLPMRTTAGVTRCKLSERQVGFLPFRHLYTSTHSLNSILSGTRNQWSSFSSQQWRNIKSYREVRQIIRAAALMTDWSRSSWQSSKNSVHYKSDERLAADWTTDAVQLTQYSQAAGDDLTDVLTLTDRGPSKQRGPRTTDERWKRLVKPAVDANADDSCTAPKKLCLDHVPLHSSTQLRARLTTWWERTCVPCLLVNPALTRVTGRFAPGLFDVSCLFS